MCEEWWDAEFECIMNECMMFMEYLRDVKREQAKKRWERYYKYHSDVLKLGSKGCKLSEHRDEDFKREHEKIIAEMKRLKLR